MAYLHLFVTAPDLLTQVRLRLRGRGRGKGSSSPGPTCSPRHSTPTLLTELRAPSHCPLR